jgi:hypothetical protein
MCPAQWDVRQALTARVGVTGHEFRAIFLISASGHEQAQTLTVCRRDAAAADLLPWRSIGQRSESRKYSAPVNTCLELALKS